MCNWVDVYKSHANSNGNGANLEKFNSSVDEMIRAYDDVLKELKIGMKTEKDIQMQKSLMKLMKLLGYSKKICVGVVGFMDTEMRATLMVQYLDENRAATEREIMEKMAEIMKIC